MISSRQQQVLHILLRDKKTTINNIANELEVNRRTIERQINHLTLAGVPITTQLGRNGGVYIDKRYKIEKGLFTERDAIELAVALSIYGNIMGSEFGQDLIGQMSLMYPEYMGKILAITDKYFEVDLFEKPIDVINTQIQTIHVAIIHSKIISIEIRDKAIKLIPISYTLRKEGLFLYGYGEAYTLINVNLIKKVIIHNETHEQREFIKCKDNPNVEVI